MAGIYNSTDGPLLIDRAGRVLGARERLEDVDVDASPVAGHIDAGRLIVLDDPQEQADEAAPEAVDAPRRGRRTSTTTPQEG